VSTPMDSVQDVSVNVNGRSYVYVYDERTAQTREVAYQGHEHFALINAGWHMIQPLTKRVLSDMRGYGDIHYHGPTSRGLPNPMCHVKVGPRGGEEYVCIRARLNGQMQTWKTRPQDFRQPAKYGMKMGLQITQDNAHHWHLASDCPMVTIRVQK
jgi:hypothetical protein